MNEVEKLKQHLDEVTTGIRKPDFFRRYPIQFQLGYTLAMCDATSNATSDKVAQGILELMEMLQQLEINKQQN